MTDIDSATITSMNDITEVAGNEAWNKNLNNFIIEDVDTDTTSYQCDFSKWHGIYRTIPEMRSTIDIWCRWVINRDFKFENENQKKITERITGNGKDTFKKILYNMKRVSKICGDAHAEIILDKANRLINLKPLNSGSIKTIANKRGIIIRYEQLDNKNNVIHTWTPEQIFHVINERIADEIHGIPEPEKLIRIIKWRHQSMSDISVVFHRYVKPLLQINADTDDVTELNALKVKFDNATKYMENIIIPKGAVESTERISIPQFSTLDPLPWILLLRDYFVLSSGVPDIILGHSRETSLAAGKLNYLAFKEKIEQEQEDYEEDIYMQLGIKIKFKAPKEIDIEMGNKAGTNLRTTKTSDKTKDDKSNSVNSSN